MKKITLFMIFGLLISVISYAQGTCSAPATLSPFGDTTVTAYSAASIPTPTCDGGTVATGGAWFSYTATATGVIIVTSDLASNPAGIDTRLHVYSGSCGALVCEGGNDDIAFIANGDPGNNFRSAATVSVTSGTTYLIAWDNRWDPQVNYAFTLTFSAVTAAPDAVTSPSPIDGATGVAVNPADSNNDGTPDNRIAIGWTPSTTGDPATNYDIYWGTDPTALTNLTATINFTATTASISNGVLDTTYYWQIDAINGAGNTLSPLWSFTTVAPRDCSTFNSSPWTINFNQETSDITSCFDVENAVAASPGWGFNNVNDVNGDGLDDGLMNVTADAESVKDDYLFGPAVILTAGNTYTFSFRYNSLVNTATPTGTESNSVRFLLSDTPTSAGSLTVLGSDPASVQQGAFGDTSGNDIITQASLVSYTYTPTVNETIHPTVHVNTTANGAFTWFLLFEMGVTSTASVDSENLSFFTLSPNPTTDFIQVKTTSTIEGIQVMNSLGQRVMTSAQLENNRLDVSELKSGMYFMKATSEIGSQTVKFIKN